MTTQPHQRHTDEVEDIRLSDLDEDPQSPLTNEQIQQVSEIKDALDGSALIEQNPRASGGGASTSATANVELHFHIGDQNVTNINAHGDSAIDKLKGLFGLGNGGESDD